MSDSEENPQNIDKEPEAVKENGSPVAETSETKDVDTGGGGEPQADDGSDEEEEDQKPGLLEQPVVIEGKRQRKKVERLSEKISAVQESELKAKEIVIPEGGGLALGSIAYIKYQLGKNKIDDLKLFHRVLFGRIGQNKDVKKNVSQFNGFGFDKESKDFEKKHEMVSRIFMAPLKHIAEVLGLEKSGQKEELVARILAFLLKPHDMNKKVPEPKGKKKKITKEKGQKRKRKTKTASGDKKSATSVADDVSSISDSDSDNDSDGQDSDSAQKKEPPKKRAKVAKKADKSQTPKKKAAPKKPKEKPKAKPEEDLSSVSSDSSDSDDEPLVKKKKQPPTDEELREDIKKILKGANLEEITMKSVCKKVFDKYPEFDLLPRKTFIKTTVKDIIN